MTERALEARERISKEFIENYYIWLTDRNTLDVKSFGKKYGCEYTERTPSKDSIKAVVSFQKYIFAGRYINAWEQAGYDKHAIWELHSEGFLSLDQDNSWQAHQLGKVDFYYISQKTAKEIYKAYKNK